MWDLAINGVDFYHIANWFYIYSFLGWLWETCYVSVRKGKLINRGFINSRCVPSMAAEHLPFI